LRRIITLFISIQTTRISLALICLIVSSHYLNAQNYWAPLYANFNTENYNLSPSNIDIEQDSTGKIIIGNLNGLMVYQGPYASTLNIEKGSVVNLVHISPQNQIFISSNNKFGYLKSNKKGELGYEMFPRESKSRIKSILSSNDTVIFLSKDYLYFVKDNVVFSIGSEAGGYQTMFEYDNKVFIKQYDTELQVLKNNKLEAITNSTFLSNKLLGAPYTIAENNFFYSFFDFDRYRLSSDLKVIPIENPLKKVMKKVIPYQAISTGKSTFMSTRNNGLMKIKHDSSYFFINQNNGLNSSIAAGITLDNQNGLWVALQNGVARLEADNGWSHWNDANDIPNYINHIAKYNNTIYISTMTGIYHLEKESWRKVEGLNSRSFDMLSTDKGLFVCAAEKGLFKVQDSMASRVSNLAGIWTIDNYESGLLLVSSELSGLYNVSNDNSKNISKLLNSSIQGTPSNLELINDSSAWLAIKWEGLFLLNLESDTASYEKYTEEHGLPNISEIEIIKIGKEFIFTTNEGFYQLNPNANADSSDFFIPVPYLPKKTPILKAAVDENKNIWFSTYNQYKEQILKKITRQEDGTYIDESINLARLPNQLINHIYPDPDEKGIIWIAGTKGLYRYDENVLFNTKLTFDTFIKSVTNGDSIIFNGFYTESSGLGAPSFVKYQPKSYYPSLIYQNNNIKFEFACSAYTLQEKNQYSYFLDGVDNDWSKWSRGTQKEYSNLSPGTYIFQLKSKNLYETEGKPTSYTFTITPPWYLTTWAKAFFILIGLVLVWFIILLYSYRLRMHRKHLKLLVADRTFEVMSQKKEIEKQYSQLSEQTEEMLLQSEQIELKNQDLEMQQEEILSINNQLEEINTYLEKKVEKRTAKIKSTLDKLKQTNKELDTFIYKASHDLKGPLSRILGLSSLAKLETPTDKNIQYLEMIESTSRDMDLLLSKLTQVHELFNQKPKIVPLLIEEILEEVKVRLNFIIQKGQINILLKNQINEPIRADHQLFYTVIFNLVENALLFRDYDSEEIHEINLVLEKDADNITIKITDNGIGIEEDLIDAVFDMFYRASDQSKGSGLGLYLVKIAVEKMHGEIKVLSKVNKGTTFTVKLPL
jgi:signal transduction histidine kinase